MDSKFICIYAAIYCGMILMLNTAMIVSNGKCECTRNGQDGVPCYAHDELKEIQGQLWAMLRRKSMKDLFEKEEQ